MKRTLWKKAGALLLTLVVLFCALPAMNAEAAEETAGTAVDFSEEAGFRFSLSNVTVLTRGGAITIPGFILLSLPGV